MPGTDAVAAAVSAAAQEDSAPAWEVLREDFTGLQNGGKMKDWDKQPGGELGAAPESFNDATADSDDADGAW